MMNLQQEMQPFKYYWQIELAAETGILATYFNAENAKPLRPSLLLQYNNK